MSQNNQMNNTSNQQFSQNIISLIQNRSFQPYNQNEQNQNIKEEDMINQFNEIRNLIENNNINELYKYININHPSKLILQKGLIYLLEEYQKNPFFYQILEILLYGGIDINEIFNYNHQNYTLLMFGFVFNDIEFIKKILNFSQDINQNDSNNKNAIIYSVLYNRNDDPEIVNLLINKKANINSTAKIENLYEIHSVFTLACLKGLNNIVRILLENMVNVNFQTQPKGDTGLHLAVQNKNYEIVRMLLSNSLVNVEQVNNYKLKALDIAKQNAFNDIIELFQNYYNTKNNYIIKNNDNFQGNINIVSNMNNNINNFNNVNLKNNNLNNNNFINNNKNNSNLNNNNVNTTPLINNNINNQQSTSSYYDNSIHSSDIGETIDDNEKESVSNLSSAPNPQAYQMNNSQIPNIVNNSQVENLYNNNNTNNHSNNKVILTQKNLNDLKNKLSIKISNNIKRNNGYNIQIPIEFISGNNENINNKSNNNFDYIEEFNKLNHFIRISNTPTLYLDLTDKSYELELKLSELKNQLKEKMDKIKLLENQKSDSEKSLNEQKRFLSKKEEELTNLKNKSNQYDNQINELITKKNELISKIPENHNDVISKKNLSPKEYQELKFQPAKYDDNFVTHILQKDLLDYQKYIQEQMNLKKYIIEKLIQNVQTTVNEVLKSCEVKIYGSYATGLSLPWSDLDLVLINRNPTINQIGLILRNLYYGFKGKMWIYSMKYSENQPLPTIKIITTNEFNSIHLNISIQDDKHYGLKCVNLVKSYLKEYSVLLPLVLALKTILKNANLNNNNSGGLSSYGLILMVVSYIQSKRENNNLQEEEVDIIGKTFHGFLGHYGIYFDFNKYVILTYPIKDNNTPIIDKESVLNFSQNSHELIIVDPLNNNNNVAQKTYQFMNLKMAFMIAFMITKEDCECGCHYGRATYENTLYSTDHCILKRMFNSVKRFSNNTK